VERYRIRIFARKQFISTMNPSLNDNEEMEVKASCSHSLSLVSLSFLPATKPTLKKTVGLWKSLGRIIHDEVESQRQRVTTRIGNRFERKLRKEGATRRKRRESQWSSYRVILYLFYPLERMSREITRPECICKERMLAYDRWELQTRSSILSSHVSSSISRSDIDSPTQDRERSLISLIAKSLPISFSPKAPSPGVALVARGGKEISQS